MFGIECLGRCVGRAVTLAIWALLSLIQVGAFIAPAAALVIELDDVAPDRIERQRAFARGTLAPTGVPDPADISDRLAEKGVAEGAPILIRIFKAESELEIWMRKDATFTLVATYPICHWTGSLGPKLREGDKQSPEGFYTIGRRQIRHLGRWREAINLGFPNLHDKRLSRTGSYILVHGGCSSTGCYAMTEPAAKVIHRLATAAIRGRQANFQVHVFPFRMTEANMAEHSQSRWSDFWRDLKAGYDAFEETRLPPRIGVCRQRYVVAKASPGARSDGPLMAVDPNKPGAAGFDVSRCGVPVTEPADLIAGVPTPDEETALEETGTAFTPTSGHSVARVERREPAAAVSPARTGSKRVARSRKHARTRERLKEQRRLRRASLGETYRRTLMGLSQ